ncbi:hypothetical protein AcV7_003350 [Taiwanofungus camphoratus]|nr:hypothetical protein AcV7_003350 [Antrodia cinnamomea]
MFQDDCLPHPPQAESQNRKIPDHPEGRNGSSREHKQYQHLEHATREVPPSIIKKVTHSKLELEWILIA